MHDKVLGTFIERELQGQYPYSHIEYVTGLCVTPIALIYPCISDEICSI